MIGLQKYFSLMDELSEGIDRKKLQSLSQNLSKNYRKGLSTKVSFLEKESALVYFLTRFLPTYAVSCFILDKLMKEFDFSFQSLVDLGAGLGSFSLAFSDILEKNLQMILVEENDSMLSLSQKIFSELGKKASWVKANYLTSTDVKRLDMAVFSYTLTELSEKDLYRALDLSMHYFEKVLVIIEPGTKKGYERILKIRDYLLNKNLNLIMPCPHSQKCPLSQDDWCHFSQRLPRHSLHKQLKQASLGFEDEKFSYLVFSKKTCNSCKKRILMPPQKRSGLISLKLCCPDGSLEQKIISKKDKELFKKTKKLSWGDLF